MRSWVRFGVAVAVGLVLMVTASGSRASWLLLPPGAMDRRRIVATSSDDAGGLR